MDDFGYINARIRARKEKLLKRSEIEELLQAENFEKFVELLSRTDYARNIERGEVDLEKVLRGINKNFADSINSLINFSSGKPRGLLYILLSKFLIANIRAIIRGKMRGFSDQEIERALFPILDLDEVKLKSLVSRENASEVLSLLLSFRLDLPFKITSLLIKKVREGDVEFFENYLERSYYEWALEKLKSANGNREEVLYILNSWGDLKNIIGVLLYLKYNITPLGKIELLQIGFLTDSQRKRLLRCQSFREVAEILSGTRYNELVKYILEEDIIGFEKRFEEVLIYWAIKGFLRDPLSISIPLAYIIAKYNEVVNLRIIAFGKYQGLESHEIRREVLIL
ncbi:MAG: V-type ATPase subunit [Candidatus Hydrothermales bacterium]